MTEGPKILFGVPAHSQIFGKHIPQVAILVLYPSLESQCINLYSPNLVLYIFHIWFDWILKMQCNCCPGRLMICRSVVLWMMLRYQNYI